MAANLKRQDLEGEGSLTMESEKRSEEEEVAAAACVNKYSLTPNDEEFNYSHLLNGKGDVDELLPKGATTAQRPHFVKIWMNYDRQTYNSKGFDCHDWPCGSLASNLQPIINPSPSGSESMMELAKLAIPRYNVDSRFKYKVLKIEKANFLLTSYFQYYMTVKVLNVTLGTVIETFRILAAKGITDDEKLIMDCRPKEGVSLDIVHHGFCELDIDVTHDIVHQD